MNFDQEYLFWYRFKESDPVKEMILFAHLGLFAIWPELPYG